MAEKDVQTILNELVRRANEGTRRLRALEERSSLVETRISSMQDSLLKDLEERRVFAEGIAQKLKDFDTSLLRINTELERINKNMDKMAKRSELKEIENILSIFNPLKTNFITRDEAERMIEEKLK